MIIESSIIFKSLFYQKNCLSAYTSFFSNCYLFIGNDFNKMFLFDIYYRGSKIFIKFCFHYSLILLIEHNFIKIGLRINTDISMFLI